MVNRVNLWNKISPLVNGKYSEACAYEARVENTRQDLSMIWKNYSADLNVYSENILEQANE